MATYPGADFFERLRFRAAWALGIQMQGRRDLYKVFGWKENPEYRDFLIKYHTNAIAKRVIDAPVRATWADPPVLEGGEAFNSAWQDVVENTKLYSNLIRFDKLVGLGRYAIMITGFDDGQSLSTPVSTPRAGSTRKLTFLQPYSEESTKIVSYDEDPKSPRFGQPLVYEITPGQFKAEELTAAPAVKGGQNIKVHWSRVLHAADNTLESPVFGQSRLRAIFNDLYDVEKVTGASAETYWLAGNRGLHINIDKDVDTDPEDMKELANELDDYANELRRFIRTRGVDVNSLGADVADPRGPFDVTLSKISAATCIPKRVLMGSEAGQLASQQDRANWAIFVEERTAEFAQPIILKPMIVHLIRAGVLPSPDKLVVTWPDPFKMNPLERGQTSAQMARSATNLSRAISTMGDLNVKYAEASTPQEVPAGGGGFFGNADLRDNAPNDPAKQKDRKESQKVDPKESGGAPETITKPALIEKQPWQELISIEEARAIIGFGKHPPVFDSKKDAGSGDMSKSAETKK